MICVESTDGIALVRFERPPANAIELESATALEEALARLEADDGTRAVVLTGHGEFFSAGLDLKVVPTYGPERQRTWSWPSTASSAGSTGSGCQRSRR